MTRLRCEAGGVCASVAAWVLTPADTADEPLAACPRHLGAARDLLHRSRMLLVRRVGVRRVHTCEWHEPMRRSPWLQRCGAPAPHVDRVAGSGGTTAVVRLCATHLLASRQVVAAS